VIQPVKRAEQIGTSGFGNMQVDHRSSDPLMTQQFFDREDIHTKLKQVSGIAMTKGMERNSFLEFAFFDRLT
jgi:hypothetical protein